MAPTNPPSTEWRVCCVHLPGEWLGWTVNVYVRSCTEGQEPGPWRLVKTCEYKIRNQGQVRNDYWKGLIRAAAAS